MNFILKFYKNLDAEIDDDKSSITSDFHIGSYLTCVFLYIFIHIYIFFLISSTHCWPVCLVPSKWLLWLVALCGNLSHLPI